MTTTRRAAVRASRERRRRMAARQLRPPIAAVHRASRDCHGPAPRIEVRLARSAPADVRAALEAARLATQGQLDVVIEPAEFLPEGSPFSLRLPWARSTPSASRARDEGEALEAFVSAFDAAFDSEVRP